MKKLLILGMLCLLGTSTFSQGALQSERAIKDTYLLFMDNRLIDDRRMGTDGTVEHIPLENILAPYVGYQATPLDDAFNGTPALEDQMFKSFVLYDWFFFKPQNEDEPLETWPEEELSLYLHEIFDEQRVPSFESLLEPTTSNSLSTFCTNLELEDQISSIEGQYGVLSSPKYSGLSIRSIIVDELSGPLALSVQYADPDGGGNFSIGLEFFDGEGNEIIEEDNLRYYTNDLSDAQLIQLANLEQLNEILSKNKDLDGNDISPLIASMSVNNANCDYFSSIITQTEDNLDFLDQIIERADLLGIEDDFISGLGDGYPQNILDLETVACLVADGNTNFTWDANTHSYNSPGIPPFANGDWNEQCRAFHIPPDAAFMDLHFFNSDDSANDNIQIDNVYLGTFSFDGSDYVHTGLDTDPLRFPNGKLNFSNPLGIETTKLERRAQVYADTKSFGDALALATSFMTTAPTEPIDLFFVMPRMEENYVYNSQEIDAYLTDINTQFDQWNNNQNFRIGGIYLTSESENDDLGLTDIQTIKAAVDAKGWSLYVSPYANLCSHFEEEQQCTQIPFDSQYEDMTLDEFQVDFHGVWQQPNAFAKPQESNGNQNTDQEVLTILQSFLNHEDVGVNYEMDLTSEVLQPYARVEDYFDYAEKYGYVNRYKVFVDNAGLYYQFANGSGDDRTTYEKTYEFLNQGNLGVVINPGFEHIDSNGNIYGWTVAVDEPDSTPVPVATQNHEDPLNYFNRERGNHYVSILQGTTLASEQSIAVTQGANYALTIDAQGTDGNEATIYIQVLDQQGAILNQTEFSLDDAWGTYELEYLVPAEVTGIQFAIQSTGTVHLDNFVWHEIDSPLLHGWNEELPLYVDPDYTDYSNMRAINGELSELTLDFSARALWFGAGVSKNVPWELRLKCYDEYGQELIFNSSQVEVSSYELADQSILDLPDYDDVTILNGIVLSETLLAPGCGYDYGDNNCTDGFELAEGQNDWDVDDRFKNRFTHYRIRIPIDELPLGAMFYRWEFHNLDEPDGTDVPGRLVVVHADEIEGAEIEHIICNDHPIAPVSVVASQSEWDALFQGGEVDVNFTSDLVITGDIVDAAKNLYFTENTRLVLSPTGSLTCSDCSFEAACPDYMWGGIEARSEGVARSEIVLNTGTTIENAHIGLLVGERRTDATLDMMYAQRFNTSAATFVLDGIQIINCGNGVLVFGTGPTAYLPGSLINGCFFSSNQDFLSAQYDSNQIQAFPNSDNMFVKGNNAGRPQSGIEIRNRNYLDLTGNSFLNLYNGVFQASSRNDVINNTFESCNYGIRCTETSSSFSSSNPPAASVIFKISGNTFTQINSSAAPILQGGELEYDNAAIELVNVSFVELEQNGNDPGDLQPEISVGFVLDNCSFFQLHGNNLINVDYAMVIKDSDEPWSGYGNGKLPNRFQYWSASVIGSTGTEENMNVIKGGVKQILLEGSNRSVLMTCNDIGDISGLNSDLRMIQNLGTLSTQGHDGSEAWSPVMGNLFRGLLDSQEPEFNSANTIEYYRYTSTNPDLEQDLIPENSDSEINIFPASTGNIQDELELMQQCRTKTNVGLINKPYSDYSVNLEKEQILVRIAEIEDIYLEEDNFHTQTTAMLNAIYGGITDDYELKEFLKNNSPLSKDVILAYMTKFGVPDDYFYEVMYRNSVVEKDLQETLKLKLQDVQPSIKASIQQVMVSNPDYDTAEEQKTKLLEQTRELGKLTLDNAKQGLNQEELNNLLGTDANHAWPFYWRYQLDQGNFNDLRSLLDDTSITEPCEVEYADVLDDLLNELETAEGIRSSSSVLLHQLAYLYENTECADVQATIKAMFMELGEDYAVGIPLEDTEKSNRRLDYHSKFSSSNDFEVFPNPVGSYFQFSSKKPFEANTEIQIFDAQGKLVKNVGMIPTNTVQTITVLDLAPGLYSLVVLENGNKTYSTTWVKQ